MVASKILTAAFCVCLLSAHAAQASLLSYVIQGTSGSGSSLDLGSGAIDISGRPYTVTGYTVSDTEVGSRVSNPIAGQFATVATFDFGDGLSFTSDVHVMHRFTRRYFFWSCVCLFPLDCDKRYQCRPNHRKTYTSNELLDV